MFYTFALCFFYIDIYGTYNTPSLPNNNAYYPTTTRIQCNTITNNIQQSPIQPSHINILGSENILESENIFQSEWNNNKNKNCIDTPTFAYENSDEDNSIIVNIHHHIQTLHIQKHIQI